MLLKCLSVVAIAVTFPVLLPGQAKPTLTLDPAVQTPSSPEKAAIIDTLERYFNGYDALEPDALSSTLHPEAVYTGGVGQASVTIERYSEMTDQLRRMGGKVKPPSSRPARTLTDLLLRGDLATVFVRQEYLPPSRGAGTIGYNSFQLYKTGGRWAIVSAVIHNDRYDGETDDRTLDVMGIRPGMTLGEIGAGDGRITFALARRVGDRGKVYANDIDQKALGELRQLCERTGTKNIETIVGKVDDPLFPKGTLDLVIMAIVYHHLEQPVALLKNLAPALKPGATLVILDSAYDRTGEKDSDRPTTRERVEAEAAEAGYELAAMDASLPRDNIFILRVRRADTTTVVKVTTAAYTPAAATHEEKPAILAAIDRWWKGHDTDDAVLLDRAVAPDTRSWFEHQGTLQFMSYGKEIERIKAGNRRPASARPAPGEKRTVVDFAQHSAVAVVTTLVEIPRDATTHSRSYTTFQLYKADDRWLVVNVAGSVPVSVATNQIHQDAQNTEAIDRMRDRDLQPDRIMDVIGLRPGMIVGEAGASYGYFTFKMSGRVGPAGIVYANDIDPAALQLLERRNIPNITTVLGAVEDPRYPKDNLDMIVVFDCLFEFSQPAAWMRSARRYLKPGGRLVIVDPDRSRMASTHFLSRQQMREFARQAGFTVIDVDDSFLKTHMIVVLQPA